MRRTLMAAATLSLLLTACGDDPAGPSTTNEPGGGTAVLLKGILVGAIYSGDLELTVGATGSGSIFPVTGCLYLSAAACTAMTGTFHNGTKVLTAASTSPALTFTGNYASGEVHGSFTGDDDGEFVIINGTVTVYCGDFSGAASGTWNFAIAGSGLDGVYDDGSGPEDLSGTVNGNALSITFSGGTASGTLSGATASGTWSSPPASGSWSGSTVGCRS